jgi:hypothetical protein
MCLNLTDSGVIDGCGADASWQVDPTGGTTTPEIKAAWDIGHRTMMRDTTLALGDGLLRESISIVPFALYSTVHSTVQFLTIVSSSFPPAWHSVACHHSALLCTLCGLVFTL